MATDPPMASTQAGFDREGWLREAGNQTGDSRRGAMVGAARTAGVIVGASQNRIRTLLGEPDVRQPSIDIWYLGRSAFGPSFESLVVRYDAEGAAIAVDLARS